MRAALFRTAGPHGQPIGGRCSCLLLGREEAAQWAEFRTRDDVQPVRAQRCGIRLSHDRSPVRPYGRRSDAARTRPIFCGLRNCLNHPVLSPSLSAGCFRRAALHRNGFRPRHFLLRNARGRRDLRAALSDLSVDHLRKRVSLWRPLSCSLLPGISVLLGAVIATTAFWEAASRAGRRPGRGSRLAAALCLDPDPQAVRGQASGRRSKPRPERLPRQHKP